jgi:ApaG protein
MPTSITHAIRVHVETQYQEEQSEPLNDLFLFAYHIHIQNNSDHTIQLMRRHWFIFDSNGEIREVEGEGVVGVQPILHPGDSHTYISACNLRSDMGKMTGSYEFERLEDGQTFEVTVPEFNLVAPVRFN